MPNLTNHKPSLRILIVGDPGSGKTGAIGSLVDHEQELFICDFDNNLNPIPQFCKNLDAVHYETLVDKIVMDANGAPKIEGVPQAWPRYVQLANKWVDSETGEDFGAPESWASNRWFVEDSMTSKGNAAMMHTLWKRKTFGKQRSFKDWGVAIEKMEGSLQMFQGAPVNYICTAHLTRLNMEDVTETIDEDGETIDRPTVAKRLPPNAWMRYPVCLGQKLPPKIGGYFNLVLQCVREGSGPNAKRFIKTVPEEDVDIKVPLPPKKLPPKVPLDQLWTILKHFV